MELKPYICQNCKTIQLGRPEKCLCGSSSFTETHSSNKEKAFNIIDSKIYRRLMMLFFNIEEWQYEQTITDITVARLNGKTVIEIETHRPGLIIGKAGSFINKLRDFLKKETNEEIEILIKESNLWRYLY